MKFRLIRNRRRFGIVLEWGKSTEVIKLTAEQGKPCRYCQRMSGHAVNCPVYSGLIPTDQPKGKSE